MKEKIDRLETEKQNLISQNEELKKLLDKTMNELSKARIFIADLKIMLGK